MLSGRAPIAYDCLVLLKLLIDLQIQAVDGLTSFSGSEKLRMLGGPDLLEAACCRVAIEGEMLRAAAFWSATSKKYFMSPAEPELAADMSVVEAGKAALVAFSTRVVSSPVFQSKLRDILERPLEVTPACR